MFSLRFPNSYVFMKCPVVKFKLARWCHNSTKSWKYRKEIISHFRPLSWLWIKKSNQRNVIYFKNQLIFLTKYLIGMKWLSLIMITTTKLLLLMMIIMMIWTCFASFIQKYRKPAFLMLAFNTTNNNDNYNDDNLTTVLFPQWDFL